MKFEKIDMEKWERKEHYHHFYNKVVCSYSFTVNLDITALKNEKLYPALLWRITKAVNKMPQFRTNVYIP